MIINAEFNKSNEIEAYLENLAESLPYYIYWKDNNFIYKGCNSKFANLVHKEFPQEVIGKDDFNLWTKEEAEVFRKGDIDVLSGNLFFNREEELIGQHGLKTIMLVNKLPIKNREGQCIGILGTSIDITERKIMEEKIILSRNQAETAIRSQTEFLKKLNEEVIGTSIQLHSSPAEYAKAIRHYYENIIAAMPGNVFWVDKDSTILGCNENMARMFNMARAEMIGRNYKELILASGGDIAEYESVRQQDIEIMAYNKPMLNKEQLHVDIISKKKTYFLTSRVPLHDQEKNITGVLGISLDITKEKQAQKAQEDFISNMEHDLRTPFSGIGGIARILHDEATDPYFKKMLGIMVKSCEQWEEIHNRIFDAIVLENKKPPILESFYIKDELDKIAAMLLATAHLKNLQIIIDCPSINEIGMIYTDRIRIHLILLSLMGNAVKFTEHGSIIVKTRRNTDRLEVSVKDTGIGIPVDRLEYIFEKFAKLERSNQYGNKFQGAGLGLYISQQYAELLGGRISVSSKINKGSEFVLSLPMEA